MLLFFSVPAIRVLLPFLLLVLHRKSALVPLDVACWYILRLAVWRRGWHLQALCGMPATPGVRQRAAGCGARRLYLTFVAVRLGWRWFRNGREYGAVANGLAVGRDGQNAVLRGAACLSVASCAARRTTADALVAEKRRLFLLSALLSIVYVKMVY